MRIANIASCGGLQRQVFNSTNFLGRNSKAVECLLDISGDYTETWRVSEISDVGLRFEEEGKIFFNIANKEYQDAKKILDNVIEFSKKYEIGEKSPHNNKSQDKENIRVFSCHAACVSSGDKYSVKDIYDTIIEQYNQDGNLERQVRFSKLLPIPTDIEYNLQRCTEMPYVKSIKEYDKNGNIKRIIEGNPNKRNEIKTIELFNEDGSKKAKINFSDGKAKYCQKGDFIITGNLLRCPVMFLYDNNGKLAEVQRNLTYEGYHIINGDTFKYDNGSYCNYEKCIPGEDK